MDQPINPEARAELDRILLKSPHELIPAERAFLRARESYLKPAQVQEYKEVLEMEEKVDIEGHLITEEPKVVEPEPEKTVQEPADVEHPGAKQAREEEEAQRALEMDAQIKQEAKQKELEKKAAKKNK